MIVGLLMAAGQSRRFGSADKLLAVYQGRQLVSHAAAAISAIVDRLIAVTTNAEVVAALPQNFEIMPQANPNVGLGDEIAFGCATIVLRDAS